MCIFVFVTSPDRRLLLSVDRDGEQLELALTPERIPKYEMGRTGAFPTFLPRIAQVVPNSPAAAAGFEPGDEIVGADGRELSQWQEFVSHIEERPGQLVTVTVLRRGEQVELLVTPADESGKGKIGVMHGYFQRLPPHLALVESIRFNWDMTRQTLTVLGKNRHRSDGCQERPVWPHRDRRPERCRGALGIQEPGPAHGSHQHQHRDSESPAHPGSGWRADHHSALRESPAAGPSLPVKERINQVGLLMIVLLMVVVLYFDIVKNVPTDLLPGSKS